MTDEPSPDHRSPSTPPETGAGRTTLQRVREHRARKAIGVTILRTPARLGPLAEFLVDEGKLEAWDTEDVKRIENALARYLHGRMVAEGYESESFETCFGCTESGPP